MILAQDLHPYELYRKWTHFWELLIDDQGMGYQEVRQRLCSQLQVEAEALDLQTAAPGIHVLIEAFIKDSQKITGNLSFMELFLLIELHERYLNACALVDIHRGLRGPEQSILVEQKAREELKRLQSILIQNSPTPDLGALKLLQTRWNLAALREEAKYFLYVLHSVSQNG